VEGLFPIIGIDDHLIAPGNIPEKARASESPSVSQYAASLTPAML
jgi:hypothetical protein